MRKWLNIYFNFSKSEFNGLIVLIVILGITSVIPAVYEWIVPERDDSMAESIALKKLILIEKETGQKGIYGWKNGTAEKKEKELFPFDPNHTSLADWQRLGFSAKQAAVLIRYTTKGGRFRQKEDLQKMFVVSTEMYERLVPYIYVSPDEVLQQQNFKPVRKPVYPLAPEFAAVHLNDADTLALMTVKGIGPAFARRIFLYGKRLGGFYKKEQLMEVFGLDSVKYLEIAAQLIADTTRIVRIQINKATFEELKSHPYLKYKQINAILQFRKQHGNYSNIADLKKVAILSEVTIEKLAPYISFDHD